jgi:hypothetical protein
LIGCGFGILASLKSADFYPRREVFTEKVLNGPPDIFSSVCADFDAEAGGVRWRASRVFPCS